jgi:cytochrome c oxidase subunit 4
MSEKPIKESTYYMVCGTLLVFTVLTYAAARFDLGWLNLPLAILVAAVKGTLIVLFFMHAWTSSRLNWIVIGAGMLWLGILFTLTLSDYLTRHPAV